MRNKISAFVCLLFVILASNQAWGWGGPHGSITEAAITTLPLWEKDLLGRECALLSSRYCIIPDTVHKDKDLAKFAMMPERTNSVYLVNLHLPGTQIENYEILRYFLGKSVAAIKTGAVTDAACFAGTLVHALEDWGCPAHSVPGDNMFTMFKQFLPPPSSHKYTLLHGPVENGTLHVKIDGYQPRLLGTSVDEAAFNLLQRVNGATMNARAQVIPIIQALYVGDSNTVTAAQMNAAKLDVEVVADALHTLLCLGSKKFDPAGVEKLKSTDLAFQIPLEATNLAMPQSSFFSRPYWGYSQSGVILRDGTNAVPLKVRVTEQGKTVEKQFDFGIGTGTRSVLSYMIPDGIFQHFEVLAGLHSELGMKGNVVFEILGNGKSLAKSTQVGCDDPANLMVVQLAGITNLQLIASSGGGDGKGNFAIWAAPCLVK